MIPNSQEQIKNSSELQLLVIKADYLLMLTIKIVVFKHKGFKVLL